MSKVIVAKYYENEVFKTNQFDNYSAADLQMKCHVLCQKDYIRGRPFDADKNHLYLCCSKYDVVKKTVQKIKNWAQCMPESIRNEELELQEYEQPLVLNTITNGGEELNTNPKRKRERESMAGDEQSKRVMLTRPKLAFFVPNEIERKPFSIRDEDGVIKWFPTPPLLIVKEKQFEHSSAYLEFIKKQKKSPKKAKQKVTKAIDVEMEVDQPIIPKVEPSDKDLQTAIKG